MNMKLPPDTESTNTCWKSQDNQNEPTAQSPSSRNFLINSFPFSRAKTSDIKEQGKGNKDSTNNMLLFETKYSSIGATKFIRDIKISSQPSAISKKFSTASQFRERHVDPLKHLEEETFYVSQSPSPRRLDGGLLSPTKSQHPCNLGLLFTTSDVDELSYIESPKIGSTKLDRLSKRSPDHCFNLSNQLYSISKDDTDPRVAGLNLARSSKNY